jgi:hypothetical protein
VSKAADQWAKINAFDSAAQVINLEKRHLYVHLHSEKARGGNLWGWLLQETRR